MFDYNYIHILTKVKRSKIFQHYDGPFSELVII